jgi:integral membrane sensor domain MASE1
LTEQSVDTVLTAVRDIGRIEGDVAGVLFLVADFSKTLSRYPAGGHLVWLDAGALALLLHLNALDVGLGSTLIATSGLIARADLESSRQDVIGVAFGSNAW